MVRAMSHNSGLCVECWLVWADLGLIWGGFGLIFCRIMRGEADPGDGGGWGVGFNRGWLGGPASGLREIGVVVEKRVDHG